MGQPAMPQYIGKMSVIMCSQSGICLHERVPMVKVWGYKIGQKILQIGKGGI